MTKKQDENKYRQTLRLKSVDELINIILRKDDKEREKNKLISNLERKIHEFKDSISELVKNIDDTRCEIHKIKNVVTNLINERDNLKIKYNSRKQQNTVLRLIINILGAIIIIESLIILFS